MVVVGDGGGASDEGGGKIHSIHGKFLEIEKASRSVCLDAAAARASL